MKLRSIQILKAFAVILIVYANAILSIQVFTKSNQASFHYLANIGFIGMDLFFIISGFLISYTAYQYKGINDGIKFLRQRFFRVNPIYYIASLLFWGTGLLNEWMVQHSIFYDQAAVVQSLIDTALIIPATDAQFLYQPFLPIAWALAFNWLAYLLFLITIVSGGKKIWVMTGLVLLLTILRYTIMPIDLRVTFVLNPILAEFLVGMIIYEWLRRVNAIPAAAGYSFLFLGMASFVVLIFWNNPYIRWAGNIMSGILSPERLFYWGSPSGLIICGCIILEKSGKLDVLWQNKHLQYIGAASFSIFLAHLTVFTLMGIIYQKAVLFLPADLLILVQVIAGIGLGLLFYRFIERPLDRWLNGVNRNSLKRPLSNPGSRPQTT